MASRNPVFSRLEKEQRRGGYATFDETRPATPYGQQAGTPQDLEQMYAAPSATSVDTGRLTYDDVVVKTGIMFAVLLGGAVVGWMVPGLFIVGALVGLVLGLVNSFKKSPSPALMLAYAGFEGLFVGGLSQYFAMRWGNGIVPQAVLATLSVFAVSLWAYKSGKVRVTAKSQRIFMIAIGGYLLFSLVNVGLMFFHVGGDGTFGPLRSGAIGALVSLFAVGLAAYSLVMDFDFIEQGVKQGAPVKFAWTCAFGLVVTLVWLYVEMLRLIAILRGND